MRVKLFEPLTHWIIEDKCSTEKINRHVAFLSKTMNICRRIHTICATNKQTRWISQVSSHVFDSTSAVANDPVRSSVCAEESCGKAVTLNIFILSRIKSFFVFFKISK